MDIKKVKIHGVQYDAMKLNGINYIDEKYLLNQKLCKNNDSYFYSGGRYHLDDYDYLGDYLGFSKLDVKGWRIVSDDGGGIPINTYNGVKSYYPITIAHYGLQLLGLKLNPFKAYMGGGVPHEIKYSAKDSLLSLRGGNNTGYVVDSDFISGGELIKIVPAGAFRVHVSFVDGEKLVVYEGNTVLRDGLQYVSLEDFYSKFNTSRIVGLKIRGKVDLYFSNAVKPSDEILKVAEWFLQNQSSDGAWKSNFDHVFYKGRTLPMESGWPSALAQGLVISFLTRVYGIFGGEDFLNASVKALNPFEVLSESGGVLALWDGGHNFYEEYPTKPASFVLNGFIFSLLGLYDLSRHGESKAFYLFEKGVETLKKMLPLYDLGNRSAYDLTHYTASSYPNIARWGYHVTHINQLYAMYKITGDDYFYGFFRRWKSYLDSGYSCREN